MKLGFIGIGLMGEPIANNLLQESGYPLCIYDVKKKACETLQQNGAIITPSISALVSECDVIFSMVPENKHVEIVYDEVVQCDITGKIFLEMSTISPKLSEYYANKIKDRGARLLDCPVVKSRPSAILGELGIYVGGDLETYLEVKPLLDIIGAHSIHLGENGNGLVMKLCHNTLVAQIQNGVNEMITLAEKAADIQPDVFAKAVSYGGAQNFYLDSKISNIVNHKFETMFSVSNMTKDVHLTQTLATEHKLNLSGVKTVTSVYDIATAMDLSELDFSSTIKVFEENNE